eukprot:COSAG01_NODE_13804_length_1532_cov_26.338451_1_plen_75_part_00
MVGGKAVRVHCGYFHDEAAAGRAAAAEAARQGVKALREETRQTLSTLPIRSSSYSSCTVYTIQYGLLYRYRYTG